MNDNAEEINWKLKKSEVCKKIINESIANVVVSEVNIAKLESQLITEKSEPVARSMSEQILNQKNQRDGYLALIRASERMLAEYEKEEKNG